MRYGEFGALSSLLTSVQDLPARPFSAPILDLLQYFTTPGVFRAWARASTACSLIPPHFRRFAIALDPDAPPSCTCSSALQSAASLSPETEAHLPLLSTLVLPVTPTGKPASRRYTVPHRDPHGDAIDKRQEARGVCSVSRCSSARASHSLPCALLRGLPSMPPGPQ